MILFFGIYLAVFFIYAISNVFKNNIFDKFVVVIISAILSILPGFRALHIGADTYMYDNILYLDLSQGSFLEPGYIFLVQIFQYFSIQPYFFYIVSFVANFLIISRIFELKKYKFLSLLSYLTFSQVFLIGFNILRQYLALSIFIFSIKYLLNSKILRFILFIILATTIHYSSIFFLCFIPLYVFIKKNYIFTSLFISLVFPFFYNFIQKNLVYILVNVTGKESAENYIGRTQESNSGFWFIYYFIILLYFIMLRRNNSHEYIFFLCVYIMFLSFYANISFLGMAYEGAGRIIVCCYFSLIFIFSYLKYDRYIVIHYFIFIFIFYFLFIYLYLLNGIHRIFPYESII